MSEYFFPGQPISKLINCDWFFVVVVVFTVSSTGLMMGDQFFSYNLHFGNLLWIKSYCTLFIRETPLGIKFQAKFKSIITEKNKNYFFYKVAVWATFSYPKCKTWQGSLQLSYAKAAQELGFFSGHKTKQHPMFLFCKERIHSSSLASSFLCLRGFLNIKAIFPYGPESKPDIYISLMRSLSQKVSLESHNFCLPCLVVQVTRKVILHCLQRLAVCLTLMNNKLQMNLLGQGTQT